METFSTRKVLELYPNLKVDIFSDYVTGGVSVLATLGAGIFLVISARKQATNSGVVESQQTPS